jgi:hypothetical protein
MDNFSLFLCIPRLLGLYGKTIVEPEAISAEVVLGPVEDLNVTKFFFF